MMKLDPFLKRVLKQVDKNTATLRVVSARLELLEKTKILKADIDILFQTPMVSKEHKARGELLQEEITRIIKRYKVRKLHINYES